MIRVGTLCLLLAPHSRAGQICAVTGVIFFSKVRRIKTGDYEPPQYVYPIELASGEASLSPSGWCSAPSTIRPLNDPDNAPAADVTRRETVRV